MTDRLSVRLVPDELREPVRAHLPRFRARPQGSGTAPLPDRQVFVYRDRVRAGRRVRLAGPAALVQGAVPGRALPAQSVGQSRALAKTPPAILAIRSRRGPRRRRLARCTRARPAAARTCAPGCAAAASPVSPVRIARKRTGDSDRPGRHRWVTERTLAWLTGYRRLTLRRGHRASHFPAFPTFAATITCYRKLTKCTT